MVARVIAGTFDGTYGLKVSKPGVDVFSAVDGDLLFDSRVGFVRALARGSFYLPSGVAGATINVGIPVGYIPIVDLYESYLSAGETIVRGSPNCRISYSGTSITIQPWGDRGSGQTLNYVIYASKGSL